MNAGVAVAVAFVAATSAVPSIAADDGWARVMRLETGTVVVVSADGIGPVRGSLVSANAAGLELALDGPSPLRVVRRFERATILEVKTPSSTSNPFGCAIAGYFGGGVLGALPGAVVTGAFSRDTGPTLVGMMVGWSIGGVHVFRKCRTHPERVVYAVAP